MRVFSRLVFLAAAAVVSSVLAADETWNGGTSAWGTAANRDGNLPQRVPVNIAPFDFVIIPSLPLDTADPILSTDATVAGLSMDSGTQLTLDGSGKTLLVNGNNARTALNGTITLTGTNSRLTLATGQSNWTNGGTLEFANGANFTATGDSYGTLRTLTNSGAIIRANDVNTVVYVPFTTISGGTLDGAWQARSTTGSAYYNGVLSSHWLSFTGVTLGSNFSAVSDSTYTANLILTGSVTNNSTAFNYPSYGAMKLASASGTFTFSGTGSLTLAGQSLNGTGATTVTTIANNGSHTLGGYGTLNVASLTNAGTIKATGGTSSTPQTLSATAIISTGAIVVDQYNTLSASGAVLSDTGSTVTMNGGTLSAGTFTNKGSLSGYGTIGTVANSGSVRATGGTAGTGRTLTTGTISGAGTVTVDPYNTLQSTGTVSGSAVSVYGTFITDACNVSVDTLDDHGVFHVEPGKTLVATGPVTSAAGSVFEANGTVTAPSVTIGGILQGSGAIHSTVTLEGTSILSPGNSPGVLTVDGLMVSDGAHYNFEVGDLVDVFGTLQFLPGAKMDVAVEPGLPFGLYTLMAANSVSGTPQFTINDLDVVTVQDGRFIRAWVPEPAILGMAAAVGLLALTRRARAAVSL